MICPRAYEAERLYGQWFVHHQKSSNNSLSIAAVGCAQAAYEPMGLVPDTECMVAIERHTKGRTALTDPRGPDHLPQAVRKVAEGTPHAMSTFSKHSTVALATGLHSCLALTTQLAP